jgi:UDP-glucose 4-epimerase
MRCLVLGGGGFIGSSIVDALLSKGHEVRVLERPGLKRYRQFSTIEPIQWIAGDLQSAGDMSAAVEGIDIVFHLVSTTIPKSSNDDPLYDVESNLMGTLRCLEYSVKAKVRKVIFISSGGTIYGTPQQIPIPETHSTDPVVSYGITKLAIEKYLYLYFRLHGLDYTVLRVSNPYGVRQSPYGPQGAIAVFLAKALSREPIEIWGDGSVVRDYVYIDDVVEAFEKVMSHQGEPRIFNIGSGEGTSINQLLQVMEEVIGHSITRKYLSGRPFDVPVNVLNIECAGQLLDWRPKVSLKEGLHKTLRWIQEQ